MEKQIESAKESARHVVWISPPRVELLRYAAWCMPRTVREVTSAVRLLGAYRQRGWFTSVSRNASVDRQGQALPLLTYPSIDWLESVLRPEDQVFEYGMGGSTLWFAERVAHVTSVDHTPGWVKRFQLPRNVAVTVVEFRGNMLYADQDSPYVNAISKSGRMFDVILVDGMARLSCVEAAHRTLKPSGLIIFDNSDKPSNHPAFQRLADWDYVRIDFCGTRPRGTLLGCTSVFSREMDGWLRRARPPRYWGRSISEFHWR